MHSSTIFSITELTLQLVRSIGTCERSAQACKSTLNLHHSMNTLQAAPSLLKSSSKTIFRVLLSVYVLCLCMLLFFVLFLFFLFFFFSMLKLWCNFLLWLAQAFSHFELGLCAWCGRSDRRTHAFVRQLRRYSQRWNLLWYVCLLISAAACEWHIHGLCIGCKMIMPLWLILTLSLWFSVVCMSIRTHHAHMHSCAHAPCTQALMRTRTMRTRTRAHSAYIIHMHDFFFPHFILLH